MLAKKKDNYSVQDSDNLNTDLNSVNSDGTLMSKLELINLQDSFDVSHIDLNKLSSEERQAEIKRCQKMNQHYQRLMYFISANSGYFNFNTSVNYYYISETLGRSTKDYSIFMAFQGLAWSIKPLYGWISDSVYPFTYRFKPYIFLFCLLHLLVCFFVVSTQP